MLEETGPSPLSPHDVRLIKVHLDNAIDHRVFVSLQLVQPRSLLHECLYQVVVVTKANLIFVEGCLLTNYERIGVLLIQLSL